MGHQGRMRSDGASYRMKTRFHNTLFSFFIHQNYVAILIIALSGTKCAVTAHWLDAPSRRIAPYDLISIVKKT